MQRPLCRRGCGGGHDQLLVTSDAVLVVDSVVLVLLLVVHSVHWLPHHWDVSVDDDADDVVAGPPDDPVSILGDLSTAPIYYPARLLNNQPLPLERHSSDCELNREWLLWATVTQELRIANYSRTTPTQIHEFDSIWSRTGNYLNKGLFIDDKYQINISLQFQSLLKKFSLHKYFQIISHSLIQMIHGFLINNVINLKPPRAGNDPINLISSLRICSGSKYLSFSWSDWRRRSLATTTSRRRMRRMNSNFWGYFPFSPSGYIIFTTI